MKKLNKIFCALIAIAATTAYITQAAPRYKGTKGTPATPEYEGIKGKPGIPKGEVKTTGTLGGTEVTISKKPAKTTATLGDTNVTTSKEPEVTSEIVGSGQKAYAN